MKRLLRDDSGFTIAEYVISAVILFVVSTAIMGVLAYAGTASASTAVRGGAVELANQRIEQARNLPYLNVGVVGGVIPNGLIVSPETVEDYTVVTDVQYAFDGAGYETDKIVIVTVSWETPQPGSVQVQTTIVGKDTRNTGPVVVNVADSDTAAPLAGVSVKIQPSGGGQSTQITKGTGLVRWGKIAAGTIVITASSANYALNLAPVKNATVIAGQPNEWAIQAVKPSPGEVRVVDGLGNPLSGAQVTITGPSDYASWLFPAGWSCPTGSASLATNAQGVAAFPLLLKGVYTATATMPGYSSGSGVSLAVIAGGAGTPYKPATPIVLTRSTSLTVLVTGTGGAPLPGATVSLPGYSTQTTGADGKVKWTLTNGGTFTVTAAKTTTPIYTSDSVPVTVAQYTDGSLTIPLTLAPTDGKLQITYTTSNWGTATQKNIYIYQKTGSNSGTILAGMPIKALKTSSTTGYVEYTVPAGDYWVTTLTSLNSSKAKQASVTAGGATSVSVSASN